MPKLTVVIIVTDDLVALGLDASKIAKKISKPLGGGGGGTPTFAQAGGHNTDKLDEALALVPALIVKMTRR